MSRVENIDNAIWADPDFMDLTADARFVYIWSFTNEHCGMSGVYKIGPQSIAFETGLDLDAVRAAWEELERADFLITAGHHVFVRTRVKRLRTRTPQIAKSIAKDLEKLPPDSPLIARFLTEYGAVGWLRDALNSLIPGPPSEPHRQSPTLSDPQRPSPEPHLNLSEVPRSRSVLSEVVVVEPETTEEQIDARDVERELFDYWRERCNHPNSRFTADRRTKLQARLRDGYTPEQIREAIDGAAANPFIKDGRRFDDLELICRSGSKLEGFIGRTPLHLVRSDAEQLNDERRAAAMSFYGGGAA